MQPCRATTYPPLRPTLKGCQRTGGAPSQLLHHPIIPFHQMPAISGTNNRSCLLLRLIFEGQWIRPPAASMGSANALAALLLALALQNAACQASGAQPKASGAVYQPQVSMQK